MTRAFFSISSVHLSFSLLFIDFLFLYRLCRSPLRRRHMPTPRACTKYQYYSCAHVHTAAYAPRAETFFPSSSLSSESARTFIISGQVSIRSTVFIDHAPKSSAVNPGRCVGLNIERIIIHASLSPILSSIPPF